MGISKEAMEEANKVVAVVKETRKAAVAVVAIKAVVEASKEVVKGVVTKAVAIVEEAVTVEKATRVAMSR